jgi:hypothetical protein
MNLTPRVGWRNLRSSYSGRIHVAVAPWQTACGYPKQWVLDAGSKPTDAAATCLNCLAATGQTGELLGDEG